MRNTILAYLHAHAHGRADRPAYFRKVGDRWRPTGWRQFRDEVRQVGRALIGLGLDPGATVGILGFNRPEWTITALGSMAAGGAPVGIYTTCAPDQVGYVVGHAESPVIVVEDIAQWQKVHQVRNQLPNLRHVVLMDGGELPEDPTAMSWERFVTCGDGVPEEVLDERLSSLRPEQLGSLIYTSGTTGPPKGVMLSHANLVATAKMALEAFGENPDYSTLSYLPLAHIAEQMFSIHVPVYVGFPVYYAESMEKIAENLQQVQPTILFGVPRVWERVYTAVGEKVSAASRLRRGLFHWATGVGRRAWAERNRGRRPAGWLALRHRLADRLVASRVRARLGLGRAQVCISGAAPIAAEILEFFAGLGVTIYEVYGQTEVCGPTTVNRPGGVRFGTVGPALPDVEVRLADDGEILVRGPNVFQGYLKDPAATAEALVDGWLHSGDLGSLDDEGFLTITGRKKEILITSGGKNVAPASIETALKKMDLVEEAAVIGEGRRYLVALVTLDREAAGRFAAENGLRAEALDAQPALIERIRKGIDEVNRRLSRPEQIRKFRILARNFTVEAGELTPTMKIRRQVINERYAELIDEMYALP